MGDSEIEFVTVAEAERITGIPGGTIRRYLRQHGHHFTYKKNNKNYFITKESLELLPRVRQMYSMGMTAPDVEDELVKIGRSVTITMAEHGNLVNVEIGQMLQDMKETITQLVEENQKQREANEAILRRVEQQDRNLLEVLRSIQKSKKAFEESKQKGSFLRRLFSRS